MSETIIFHTNKLYRTAWILSIITIIYNLIEGIVSTYYGSTDETLALFGFGIDSFVEVLSGLGIAHMVYRMKHGSVDQKDGFEKTALKITGTAFYFLTLGLVAGALMNIINGANPESTLVGIIISVISILTMYVLFKEKLRIGRALDSAPIISDANCTKTCFYLSFVLFGSSVLYESFGIPYVDAIGSLGIAWYAFKEGREAFGKAQSKNLSCDCDGC